MRSLWALYVQVHNCHTTPAANTSEVDKLGWETWSSPSTDRQPGTAGIQQQQLTSAALRAEVPHHTHKKK